MKFSLNGVLRFALLFILCTDVLQSMMITGPCSSTQMGLLLSVSSRTMRPALVYYSTSLCSQTSSLSQEEEDVLTQS